MKKIYLLILITSCSFLNIYSQCTSLFLGGGSYSDEISVTILDCSGSVIYQSDNITDQDIYDCIDLPESYTIEMYDDYGDGWTGNILTLDSDNYTMSCAWPGCVFESIQVDVCSGCIDIEACNYSSYAEVDNGSCIYELDCEGLCGGNSIEDFEKK